jgi:hypothetical protein
MYREFHGRSGSTASQCVVHHGVDVFPKVVRIDGWEPMPADEQCGRGQTRASDGTEFGDRPASAGDDHGLPPCGTIYNLTTVITEVSDGYHGHNNSVSPVIRGQPLAQRLFDNGWTRRRARRLLGHPCPASGRAHREGPSHGDDVHAEEVAAFTSSGGDTGIRRGYKTAATSVFHRVSSASRRLLGPSRFTEPSRSEKKNCRVQRALARKVSRSTTTRDTFPAATNPDPSETDTVKVSRRPWTRSSEASARTSPPTPTGTRWSNCTRFPTLVLPSGRCPSKARHEASSHSANSRGVASTGTSPAWNASAVSSSVT